MPAPCVTNRTITVVNDSRDREPPLQSYRYMQETQARTVGDPIAFIPMCWVIGIGFIALGWVTLASLDDEASGSSQTRELAGVALGGGALITLLAIILTVRWLRRRRRNRPRPAANP